MKRRSAAGFEASRDKGAYRESRLGSSVVVQVLRLDQLLKLNQDLPVILREEPHDASVVKQFAEIADDDHYSPLRG